MVKSGFELHQPRIFFYKTPGATFQQGHAGVHPVMRIVILRASPESNRDFINKFRDLVPYRSVYHFATCPFPAGAQTLPIL